MGNKLYVGNLSFTMNDESLSQLFAQVGTVVSAKVIMENSTGRSKGFGFVEMSSNEEAQAAIAKLNGTSVEDRSISVAEARPMVPRENRGYGGGGDRGGDRGGRNRY